ncbi:MAG TPA: efflux RND transporter periplasmic adaptor subunit [Rhizomicrobium sp.]|nr:efflux RND transporter periplasmic adaptor subunit [Rhizomicrobium sp.]
MDRPDTLANARDARPAVQGTIPAWRRWAQRLPGGERVFWIGLGLLAVLLLIWAVKPSATSQHGKGFGAGGPTPVGVAVAAQGDIDIRLTALGTVTPLATVTVRPQVSGELLKFDVAEGQMVKAGQVLAEIDPRTFQAALDQAQGALDRDKAALANAVIDLGRYRSLAAQNAISQQTVATQEALVLQDQGVVKSDEGNVETARINLLYCKVTSPVAGRVGLRQVDPGNLIEAGQTNGIVVVTELQPISVVFALPEDNVNQIMGRVNAGATLSADAYDRAQTVKLTTGTLSTVDNEIDTTTGTVKLRAMFDNTDNKLFPSQFVNIKLLVDTLHDQTYVPGAAIQRGSQGTYVYVVNADKTVSMRTVTIGPTDGDKIDITQGLKPGDTVVTDGSDRLSDGADVTLPNMKGKVNAPSAAAPGSTPPQAHSGRRGMFMKIMKKLTPAERTQLRGMERDQRMDWIKQHYEELMKRPDQPDSGGP